MPSRRIYIAIAALFLVTFSLQAQTVLKGTVRNDAGEPLPSVMVRATVAKSRACHAVTRRDGAFAIELEAQDTVVTIRFSRLGYDSLTVTSRTPFRPLDVTLHRAAIALREVTVKAPTVRVKGDTIAYNMADIAGKGDVTLQDALRKVPGVEVGGDGGIKYNGKNISNLYINSMDLMGGKYNIATTSIPHTYVSTVEVLTNHEDIKIDRKVFNDNVALNIRLKPKAMFKPMGKYEATAGYGDKPLGEISGAGMMFTDNFQTILTLKAGNIGEFSAYDNIVHYRPDRETGKNYASGILGNLSAPAPPLGRDRWISPLDISTTINFVDKLSEDATIRTNMGYEYGQAEFTCSESAVYFGGESDVTVSRAMSPSSFVHKPSLAVEYRLNSDRRYIRNAFYGNAAFNSAELPVSSTAADVTQQQTIKSFFLSDYFEIALSHGKTKWHYNSSCSFAAAPLGRLSVRRDEPETADMMQRARSYSFSTTHSFSSRITHRRSSLLIPLSLNVIYDRIHTDLCNNGFGDGEPMESRNSLYRLEIRASFAPRYEYATRYNRLVLRLACPVDLNIHDWKNDGDLSCSDRKPRLGLSPSFYLNYEASAKSTFRITSGYNDSYGDILDLLTSPVMTDYMSMKLKSGILAHNRTVTSGLHYGFKSPMTMWNGRVDIGFTRGWNNLMSRTYVSSGLVAVSNFLSPSGYDLLNTGFGISRRINSIRTNLSLTGSMTWSRRRTRQNDITVKYYGNTYLLSPKINTNPFGWFELTYALDMSVSSNRYLGVATSYSSLTHNIGLKLFPSAAWEVDLKSDITRKEIASGQYKTMPLFDTGAVYKHKSLRFGLRLRNILNSKTFSYNVFNGLDRFSYSYNLRGRELLLSVTFVK